MYNRYIPQPDGSYRRSRMQEPCRPTPPPLKPVSEQPCEESKLESLQKEHPKQLPCPQPRRNCPHQRQRPTAYHKQEPQPDTSVGNFLKRLLPKDFDTGDLLIVLLLLLMAGDCAEDQNSALLTLALYFFM